MKTRTIIQKLKSTKLWCTIAGIVVGIVIALGGDSGTISTVAGSVTSVISLVTYIVTEGKIDATAICKLTDEENKEDAEQEGETSEQ